MALYLNGIGVLGPGLAGWAEGRAVLAGEIPYCEAAVPEPSVTMLPPNEQRRSSDSVRWALHVAQEAIQQADVNAREVISVFASSEGETDVLDRLCTALATPHRTISPTLFHHSVHNAVSGYWGIATGSQQSSTVLACYDFSFCAALLESAAYAETEERPVLLVTYELPPPPIIATRPLRGGFAAALLFMHHSTAHTLAWIDLDLSLDPAGEPTNMNDARLEALRTENHAARSLPLLAAIARQADSLVRLEYLEDQHLVVQVRPC
jgi:Beta-ketoacyl synthase, N-terminal domain